MDFLQNIRIITIPYWVRIIIAALLLTLFAFNAYIGVNGVFEKGMKDWAEAATNLLGVLLPIIILSILLAFSQSGIPALREKTESLLISVLPEYLGRIAEENGTFYDPKTSPIPADKKERRSDVRTNLHKGRCFCDYKIIAPDLCVHGHDGCDLTSFREIIIRVELNVRKINFNVFLDKDLVEEIIFSGSETDLNSAETSAKILEFFGHSASGASGVSQETSGNDYIVYHFNNKLLERKLDGKTYYCIVATANLKPDFLWDASERLYFCQDMMFMVRAFYSEYPRLFAEYKKTKE